MVDLPESLRAVYTETLRERDGSYVIEVPKQEVEHDAVSPGEVCRVALIDRVSEASNDTDNPSGESSERTDSDSDGPPVSEGEVRQVAVESLGDQGDGIAKVERGYVVIVPDARPGDEPTVRIDRTQDNVAFASVVDRGDRTL